MTKVEIAKYFNRNENWLIGVNNSKVKYVTDKHKVLTVETVTKTLNDIVVKVLKIQEAVVFGLLTKSSIGDIIYKESKNRNILGCDFYDRIVFRFYEDNYFPPIKTCKQIDQVYDYILKLEKVNNGN